LPFKLDGGALWAAADLHGDRKDDLLVLTPEGKLYQIDNTHEE
jgi:hypothetical protein